MCYVGTWAVYRPNRGSFSIEHIDPTLCTHLIYSFAGLNSTQDTIRSLGKNKTANYCADQVKYSETSTKSVRIFLRPPDPWQDLTENYGKGGYSRITALKSVYPHLKVSIAIGGWNEGSANYSAMAGDPARRSRFISSALEFLR